ncbi:MAG: hypothetical protein JKY67_12335 [Pseudomonadales bacterium]|nr:hypothetical protein [Pseudomonadales bacterium]
MGQIEEANYNLPQNQILLENFKAGWPGYELRFVKDAGQNLFLKTQQNGKEKIFKTNQSWCGESKGSVMKYDTVFATLT